MSAVGAARAAVPWYVPGILIGASSVSILSTDLYTPSLPHLPAVFGTDAGMVQLTMSLNLLGFAAAQLLHGPLSDKIGRRPVLLGAMVVFGLTTLACAFAASIGQLIVARTLQGMAGSAEAVLGLAMIRDLYDEKGAVRVLALYGVAMALAPAVGPVIGGFVHVSLGWRANFFILVGLIVVVCLLIWRFLPESLAAPERRPVEPASLFGRYLRLLIKRRFFGYAFPISMLLGGLFAYITEGPFVFIDHLGVETQHYGFYHAVIVGGYIVGSYLSNRMADRASLERIVLVGFGACVIGVAWSFAAVLAGAGPAWLTVGFAAFVFGLGPAFAVMPVRALAGAFERRGVTAALLGATEMIGGSLGAFIVLLLHDGTAWPMVIILALCTSLALAVYYGCRPWRD